MILRDDDMNNNYDIEVTYPLEAYQALGEDTVSIEIPVQTYYEGYNNPNAEFNNAYRLVEKGAVLNWFDVEAPEGRFSINDQIGNITATWCEVKELNNFPIGIRTENAMHIADVVGVHADKKIIFSVICTS